MKIFFQIALRNVLRHTRRSLITVVAVALGLGAVIFLWSFTDGAHDQMVRNITSAHTADAQILPAVLEYIYDTTGAIDNPEEIRKLLKKDKRIKGFAERVIGGAIISSASNSLTTYAIGIDVEKEEAIGSDRKTIRGERPPKDMENWIGMGERMREILDVEIGDKIVVVVQNYFGSLSGESFRLVGTFRTGNDQIDNQSILISKKAAQKLFSFDDRLSRIALKIDPQYKIQDVVEDLQRQLKDKNLRVQSWEELLPMVGQMIHFNNQTVFFVMLIVLIVVALGILNTMMMSIVERIHEFGLMMALGTKTHQIVLVVTLETLILVSFGSLLGLALGVGATLYFGHVGINLSEYLQTLSNLLIGARVYPLLDIPHLLISFAVILFSTLIVSLYPATKASRLEPVEVMRQMG